MADQISKPDANPILIAVLNWFFFGFVGYWLIEQKKKAIGAAVYSCVLYIIGLGWIFSLLAAVDGYMVATKLAAGETLEDSHCEIAFLAKLPLWH
mmetsp:Transcript_4363/g.6421  ORF Transcript_4363/g.6421 Transcript_4363/m.6421 type:complete len:95 (-) Transcript_4363:64-348(-)